MGWVMGGASRDDGFSVPYFCIAEWSDPDHSDGMDAAQFEWDEQKDLENQVKHGVTFALAQHAFLDPHRVIVEDVSHSADEDRFYCPGRAGGGILTVRFTFRQGVVRIIGAGYWRKGRKLYEETNPVHR
ncbi:MAG: BrnT family toxin [Thermodesulfobacteriota bacterium]